MKSKGAVSFAAGLLAAAASSAEPAPTLYESALERMQSVAALAPERGAVAAVSAAPARADRGGGVELEPGRAQEGGAPLRVPAGARRFLPDSMARAAPDALWAKDSAIGRERAQQVADHFARFYPDVVYHVDWDDETVNAYAWMENGRRHVALLGGLIRHRAIQIEGMALVLAHELGHHYGGPPTYPSGLSCEGQADYWGAGTGMRRVWGDEYRAQMLSAIEQMDQFFSRGLFASSMPEEEEARLASAADGCGHPPRACRRQTYEAALAGRPKPECAGPAAPAGQSIARELSAPAWGELAALN